MIRLIRSALALAAVICLGSGTAVAQAQVAPPEATPAPAALSPAPFSGPFEHLSLFVGLDGSKQPQDLGINANMGVRFAANAGLPLVPRANLGLQAGAALNLSDAAVHVLDQIEGTSRRTQTFVTLGLFQRAGRANWSVGYDALFQQYYDDFTLGQVRGSVGVDVTSSDEIGAWATKRARDARGSMGDTPVTLAPVSQLNGYFRHLWPSAARTTVWAGLAAGHHNVVWVLPDNSRDDRVLVYGAELQMPLSDRFAVTGAANFLTPTATGTVDAYLGLTFYPGRTVLRRTPGRYAPPMTVANNPTFPVNLSR